MKALSIRQPWAWLIVQGFKPVENRNWSTKVRGEILVHAGKEVDRNFPYEIWEQVIGRKIPRDLPLGCIVGKVKIVRCVTVMESPWFFGRYGFLLAEPVQFDVPTPWRGKLGFFDVDQRELIA